MNQGLLNFHSTMLCRGHVNQGLVIFLSTLIMQWTCESGIADFSFNTFYTVDMLIRDCTLCVCVRERERVDFWGGGLEIDIPEFCLTHP